MFICYFHSPPFPVLYFEYDTSLKACQALTSVASLEPVLCECGFHNLTLPSSDAVITKAKSWAFIHSIAVIRLVTFFTDLHWHCVSLAPVPQSTMLKKEIRNFLSLEAECLGWLTRKYRCRRARFVARMDGTVRRTGKRYISPCKLGTPASWLEWCAVRIQLPSWRYYSWNTHIYFVNFLLNFDIPQVSPFPFVEQSRFYVF